MMTREAPVIIQRLSMNHQDLIAIDTHTTPGVLPFDN
jgi:hypothetical protein